MKTKPLGLSGVEVSSLCLGAMYFGSRNDKTTSHRLLDVYLDAGGSFIDTANIYAHWITGFKGGESETLLGDWMKARGNRSSLFLATKVGFSYGDVKVGLSARQIEDECNKSLKRLQIETIDLYYAHVDDRNTPLEETLQAFDKLVKAGKVRYIGASNYLAWRLEQAKWISQVNGGAAFCCVQQRHTYLRLRPGASVAPQTMTNDDLSDYCKNTGMTLLPYTALEGGSYTRADHPFPKQFAMPDNDRRLETLRAIAQESGATVNQIVLAWMLQSAVPTIPLIAASEESRLRENIGALDVQLTAAQIEWLDRAGVD